MSQIGVTGLTSHKAQIRNAPKLMMDLKSTYLLHCIGLSRVCMQLRNQMSRLRDEQQRRRRIYEATVSQTDRITIHAVNFKRGMLLENGKLFAINYRLSAS